MTGATVACGESYLNGYNSIKRLFLKLVVYDIASDDLEITKTSFFCLGINIELLGLGVGKGSDFGVWEDFCEVQGSRTPPTSIAALTPNSTRNLISYPRSRMLMPSCNPAFSMYVASIAVSAWANVSWPLGYRQHEYFILGPRHAAKTPVPTS
jgi:hypothetical protein